ncbi:MAG: tetratricopeptide repeat protein [Oscillochloris sp.]|nr:tetratricopeptide repeat protein [Oscillochloris sp.]
MHSENKRDEGLRLLRRGLELEHANRVEEAVAHYRDAARVCPTLREAHNALGVYYQRSGLMAKAAEAFRNVVALDGDFLAYYNLGYVLVELERFEDALESFGSCLSMAPDDSATHMEIGFIHLSRGEYGQAISHLQHPLHSYPEDWEVHNMLGKSYLGLRRFDEALAAFGRAVTHTNSPRAQIELLDNIATVMRHREFHSLNTVKDQVYAQDGVVYLGSAQDDGLNVRTVEDYHFTYPDIGTTLQRLIALVQSSGWHYTAILAADTLAQPLAAALSEPLKLPIRSIGELTDQDHVLLVFAVAREAELLLLTLERLPAPATAVCLGLNWQRHSRILPDIIGIAAQGSCSVPWESELRRLRSDGAPSAAISACLQQATEAIGYAIRETPLDHNLSRQMRYYTRSHRRLNVHG